MNKKGNSIFDHVDYKAYLCEALLLRGGGKRGERTRLAQAVRCQTAYVSHVLNGSAHFSLEQAEHINRFLGHGPDPSAYFLLMVQAARAGTATLRAHFTGQMRALAEHQFVLKERLQFKRTLTREDQMVFYSSWHYGAIHALVAVPGCGTERGVAARLNIPLERAAEVLQFLLSVGLVQRGEQGTYAVGTTHIHLEADSPMISKHHANWRLQAIQSLDRVPGRDLHYSSVISVSQADVARIKEILVTAIEDIRAVVKPSADEAGFCYCVDLFELGQ
jgi:uncharacterized protein (TIGR02147 family)